MRLYVVRHGQTSWNVEGRTQGHTDVPLNKDGHAQAAALEEAFRTVHLDQILSSDLSRASQTAEAIQRATGAPLEIRADLRERCFGKWEGDDFKLVGERSLAMAAEQGVSSLEVRPPDGESFADLWRRVGNVMSEIDNTDGALAVVSHGGTCSALLARLVRGTLETTRSFTLGNTAITELERRPEGLYRLVRYSDTSHLDRLLAIQVGR